MNTNRANKHDISKHREMLALNGFKFHPLSRANSSVQHTQRGNQRTLCWWSISFLPPPGAALLFARYLPSYNVESTMQTNQNWKLILLTDFLFIDKMFTNKLTRWQNDRDQLIRRMRSTPL